MKKKILILCTGNSCRSQMAEGLLRSFDTNLDVESAGTNPAAQVHPNAVFVMKELGIDLSENYPKKVDRFLNDTFDYVITVCDHAKETCPVFLGKVKDRLHIGFDDPAEATGTEAEILKEFRRIRDEIKKDFYDFYLKNLKNRENIIKVYGSGCANCKKLEQMCYNVLQELDADASVVKVTDLQEIIKTGILSTPGLEINGKIISTGKLPTQSTLFHWIQDNLN